MNEDYAPIIIFVYNRLNHVQKVIDALMKNRIAEKSIVYIYSDAAKDSKAEEGVSKVRNYIYSIEGFKKICVIERDINWGIEKSEVDAISSVIDKHGKAIMIEDDIVVGPDFLEFINLSLKKYADNKKIFSVTGYSFIDANQLSGLPRYSFIQLVSAWGWATWADRWNLFKKTISKKEVKSLCTKKNRDRFDMGFHYSDMLFKQYRKKHLTWDILWYWTSYINDGLTLIPTKTMVNNIGMDGTGVHFLNKGVENRIEEIYHHIDDFTLPEMVEETASVNEAVKSALSLLSGRPTSIIGKMKWKFKEWIKWTYRKLI